MSRLTADVLVTDDPLSNSSYTYGWEIILPSDVTTAPATVTGGDPCDTSWEFAAPDCDDPCGISDSGQTFTVRVTITGNQHGNTGYAEAQFGIALLGDINNDRRVDIIDRSMINAFLRGSPPLPDSITMRDCDVFCDSSETVDITDKSVINAVLRGTVDIEPDNVSTACPLR